MKKLFVVIVSILALALMSSISSVEATEKKYELFMNYSYDSENVRVLPQNEGSVCMLKNIPPIIPPELMKALMEMGHGDEMLLADGNYPSESAGPMVIRADGHGVPELLEAVLQFFPLDTFVDINVVYIDPGHDYTPEIWDKFKEIFQESGEDFKIGKIGRFEFYDRVSKSYCIVATGEEALYACIILKKGVIK